MSKYRVSIKLATIDALYSLSVNPTYLPSDKARTRLNFQSEIENSTPLGKKNYH